MKHENKKLGENNNKKIIDTPYWLDILAILIFTCCIPERPGSNLSQHLNGGLVDSQTLGGRAQLDDLNHLLLAVWKCPDDQQPGIEVVSKTRKMESTECF